MSILDKLRGKQTEESEPVVEPQEVTKKTDENNLTLDEIAFILTSIKDSTFKVGDVELVKFDGHLRNSLVDDPCIAPCCSDCNNNLA